MALSRAVLFEPPCANKYCYLIINVNALYANYADAIDNSNKHSSA